MQRGGGTGICGRFQAPCGVWLISDYERSAIQEYVGEGDEK